MFQYIDSLLSEPPVLAIVNNVAMNTGVHGSCSTLVSLGYMPSSGIAGSYGSFIPSFFKGISILFSIVAVSIYIPTKRAVGFPFIHILSSIYFCSFFVDGHSDWYEVIPHCSFDLHFSK